MSISSGRKEPIRGSVGRYFHFHFFGAPGTPTDKRGLLAVKMNPGIHITAFEVHAQEWSFPVAGLLFHSEE